MEQLLRQRRIQNTVKHPKWSLLQKECLSAGAKPEIFQGKEFFDKHFVKNTRKKDATGKYFGVTSPTYSYNYIFNGKFNPNMDIIRARFIFTTLNILENARMNCCNYARALNMP